MVLFHTTLDARGSSAARATLKYKTCPYYTLVKSGQKTWICNLRKKTMDYIISRMSHGKRGRKKIIKSLLQNERLCEYEYFQVDSLEHE